MSLSTTPTRPPGPSPRSGPERRRPTITGALTAFSLRRSGLVLVATTLVVAVSAIGFVRLSVDTDPENMLPADDPVRLRNAALEAELGAHPMIVVGLFGTVDTVDAMAALDRVHDRVVELDDVVDDSTFGPGAFITRPPESAADVDRIVAGIEGDPLLAGNVLLADEPGAAMFIALTDKSAAETVAAEVDQVLSTEPALADLARSIAGQPLAEDAFGRQMFVQMAVFAPLAGLLVFALMLFFLRRLRLVLAAMALAMATVIVTMGALVGSGNTLHIMSSMIPIFLMPIAILDSVHVLSEFDDRIRVTLAAGRRPDVAGTVVDVVDGLRRPIGYTSLTTAVGFGALLLVPIPPVRVFGIFVALGVALAWLLTFTLLPALLVRGASADSSTAPAQRPADPIPATGGVHRWIEELVTRRRWLVVGAALIVSAAALPGLAAITVNDNPVRWFRADHEVRQATERLGQVLPGTFTAGLVATETEPGALDRPETAATLGGLADHLRSHPEVGGAQLHLDGDYPMLRSGSVANLRLQLRTGDNTAMQSVVDEADRFLTGRTVDGVELAWAGEAYLNLTWQQKMVSGMLIGFATTLVAIFGLLVTLFRSLRWAALAMVPVAWTVLVVYGAMAVLGRDFDMPVAVLSTMVLGIGVDFSIHFVERFRNLTGRLGSGRYALHHFYGEPARALTRNALVISLGFLPLVLSSLVPYVVVGVLLASIVGLSWLASVVVLPALVPIGPGPDRLR